MNHYQGVNLSSGFIIYILSTFLFIDSNTSSIFCLVQGLKLVPRQHKHVPRQHRQMPRQRGCEALEFEGGEMENRKYC